MPRRRLPPVIASSLRRAAGVASPWAVIVLAALLGATVCAWLLAGASLADRAQSQWTVLAGGIAISLLSSGAVAGLAASRAHARRATNRLKLDVAMRRETEQRLRAGQEALRDAVDSISEAFAIYDSQDMFVMCNDAHRATYALSAEVMRPGFSFDDSLRQGLARGQYPDAVGREEEWIAQRREAHRNPLHAIEQRLADGRCILISERRMASGGVAGLSIDITVLRDSEQRRRDLEQRLFHSQKLEALGTLAGGIAHDLNNTLTPILALADLTLRQLPHDSEYREDLETIVQAARRGRGLVQQILAFSRNQQPDDAAVDLAATVHQALRMLRATTPATVNIAADIGEVPPMLGDAGQLQQVVVNLVTNAVQAIGGQLGTVTVDLLPDREQAGFARLRVSDTGCGMDPQTVARIFEPFFTTKAVGEGTGLGLSIVHGIVTAHGGRIEVRSKAGKGTAITVLLPAAIAAAPRITAEAA